MQEIDYQIAVMQAFKEGKTIERKEYGFTEWKEDFEPSWDWIDFDYRIKKELNYRPYENIREFLHAQKQHGMYVKGKVSRNYFIPTALEIVKDSLIITISDLRYDQTAVLTSFVWQDGTPCGIRE